MGPKKKGKGSKLARMSEDERMRYLQHRAAVEEEARRRKEQLISTYMKNKLKREEAFSRLNMAKINQQWRKTLRGIKCAELKQDLEALYKWFDHTANKKSKLIESLLEDLDEAETQYSRVQQCHMETVDRLLVLYNQRINFLHEIYEEDRDGIYKKATTDVKSIVYTAIFDQEHLQSIIFSTQETFQSSRVDTTKRQSLKTDELRNSMLTELETLVNSREAKMEVIWQSFQIALKTHWNQTEDRRREYVTLRNADMDNCRQIFHFYQQINSLVDIITHLRNHLTSADSAVDERFVFCKAEKETCNELFFVLRRKLVAEKDVDRKKLSYMTGTAQHVVKDLERIHSKGEQILQLMTLCRKLETLNEKVCPGGLEKEHLTRDQLQAINQSQSCFQEPLAEEVFKKFSKLSGFWERHNRMLLEKEALALHHKSLVNEQRHLKGTLRRYLSDFVIGQYSVKAPFMVNWPNSSPSLSLQHQSSLGSQATSLGLVKKSTSKNTKVVTIIEGHHSPYVKYMLAQGRKSF